MRASTSNPLARHVERWGWYSIGVNLSLIAIHAAVAIGSGSLAVTAELLHNFGDALTAVALLVGLKLSVRRSSAFPYGLYKLENLIAAGMAMAIFFTAYEIGQEALAGRERPVTVSAWMLVSIVISTTIPLAFAHFETRAGHRFNSPALLADAKEFRVHFLTTGLVFFALLSQRTGIPIDRVATLIILIAIIKTGLDLFLDAMRVLLDASLEAGVLDEIRRVISADPALKRINWLMGRNAGRLRFVEAGVGLRVNDLARAEAVIQRIEARVRERVPHVERVLIHAEPTTGTDTRIAVPLENAQGRLSAHFGNAPYFAFLKVSPSTGRVEGRETILNPFRAEDTKKGLQVANWLIDHETDVVLLQASVEGKGPGFALGDAGIEICRTDSAMLEIALEEYVGGQALPGSEQMDMTASDREQGG